MFRFLFLGFLKICKFSLCLSPPSSSLPFLFFSFFFPPSVIYLLKELDRLSCSFPFWIGQLHPCCGLQHALLSLVSPINDRSGAFISFRFAFLATGVVVLLLGYLWGLLVSLWCE